MTKTEAKEKWCPMARANFPEEPSGNREIFYEKWVLIGNANPEYSRCIADKCACWVWDNNGDYHEQEGHCGLVR